MPLVRYHVESVIDPPVAAQPLAKPYRVLVCDDQPDVLEALRLLLKGQGWQAVDTVTADIAYEDGKESYKNIRVGGKAVNTSMDEIGGSRSTGEFQTGM